MTAFNELDPLLHSQLRLAIVSILAGSESAEFGYIQDKTGATSGNLSVQISKLREAGYISVVKKFRGNYPLTICRITPLGMKKFREYVDALREYLKPGE